MIPIIKRVPQSLNDASPINDGTFKIVLLSLFLIVIEDKMYKFRSKIVHKSMWHLLKELKEGDELAGKQVRFFGLVRL